MRRIFVVILTTLLVAGLAPAWGQTGGGTDPDPAPTKEPEPDPGPSGRADVSVTYDGPAQVLAGERASFVFTATNQGPDPAESMSLVVSTPPGLDDLVVTSDDPAISCTWAPYDYYGAPPEADGPTPRSDGGYADCQAGTVAPGASFSVTLEATRTAGARALPERLDGQLYGRRELRGQLRRRLPRRGQDASGRSHARLGHRRRAGRWRRSDR